MVIKQSRLLIFKLYIGIYYLFLCTDRDEPYKPYKYRSCDCNIVSNYHCTVEPRYYGHLQVKKAGRNNGVAVVGPL